MNHQHTLYYELMEGDIEHARAIAFTDKDGPEDSLIDYLADCGDRYSKLEGRNER
jgi:hypothetical protein